MSETNNYTYEEVKKILKQAGEGLNVEEVHGMLTGWICINGQNNQEWFASLFPKIPFDKNIEGLYNEIANQLQADDFVFDLLIPQDSVSLKQQGKALVAWCQSFLTGIGLTGFSLNSCEQIQEPIKDLSEIAKLDYTDLNDESEEDQMAFVEVAEYVRMAVMLIYTELQLERARVMKKHDNGTIH